MADEREFAKQLEARRGRRRIRRRTFAPSGPAQPAAADIDMSTIAQGAPGYVEPGTQPAVDAEAIVGTGPQRGEGTYQGRRYWAGIDEQGAWVAPSWGPDDAALERYPLAPGQGPEEALAAYDARLAGTRPPPQSLGVSPPPPPPGPAPPGASTDSPLSGRLIDPWEEEKRSKTKERLSVMDRARRGPSSGASIR